MSKTIAERTRRTQGAHSRMITIIYVSMSNWFKTYTRISLLVAVCSSPWFAAGTAHAQEPVGHGFQLASAEIPSHLFAPDVSVSAPNLQISMAEPSHLRISDSHQSSVVHPNGHHATERIDDSGLYSGNFTLAHAVLHLKYGSPVSGRPLNPESILAEVEAKYKRWESSLADSRSLTNVSGASVYPIVQIDSGDWHLPITLNTVPVEGNETRW